MGFREKVLTTGRKVLLGRNAENNDELLKTFKGKENVILHTEAPGSPFCVIENLDSKPNKKEIQESAVICAIYSQDWRDNKQDVKVSVFSGKDVSKKFWMKKGTWRVRQGVKKTIKVKKKDILAFQRKEKK